MVRTVVITVVAIYCSCVEYSIAAETPALVDTNATPETKSLFLNLKKLAKDKVLFGHQHTTCYGVGWKGGDKRSDVKDVTGSFPAVYGWDMGYVRTDRHAKLIIDAFERGGINTISWHMKHPITGGNCKATKHQTVREVLPGGSRHEHLKAELDRFAAFMGKLKDGQGRPVPIIFRPWHEHTGGWFWWGSKSCTPDEFVELWRFTVRYLRDTKNVHNLLWAYSPSQTGISNLRDYETNRFPGYDFVDILGIDCYSTDDTKQLVRVCRIVVELANKRGKVPALTEFGWRKGLNNCKRNDWYKECFLKPIKRDPLAAGIAWALTWGNASKDQFWVPYQGHPGVDDFKAFYSDSITVFENDLPNMYAPSTEPARSPR